MEKKKTKPAYTQYFLETCPTYNYGASSLLLALLCNIYESHGAIELF